MLFSISGEDTFRSREFLHQCEAAFRQKHDPEGHHIQRVDGKLTESLESLLSDASTVGLFQAKRLMIVEDFFALLKHETEKEQERLERVASFSDSTVIVYHTGPLPKSAASEFLKNQKYSREFASLTLPEFRTWVATRFHQKGMTIDARTLERVVVLLSFSSTDLWTVHNEIEKIVHGAVGTQIYEHDIERISGRGEGYSAFALLDALWARDAKTVYAQAAELSDEELFPLLSLIGGQIRTLLLLKDYGRGSFAKDAAALLGIHPYVVKKLNSIAQEITYPELALESELVVRCDRAAKSLRTPKEVLALHLFVQVLHR